MNREEKVWRLSLINADLSKTNIPLKEIKKLWFEAKEILSNLENTSVNEIKISVNIFDKGSYRIEEFIERWLLLKLVEPTDEELEILTEAFNEASWAFNFLETYFPSYVQKAKNEGFWEKLERGQKIIKEEKEKRQQIKDLQAQIATIKNQPKNSNNEEKIRNLQEQLNAKKNQENSHFSQNISNAEEKNNSEKGVVGGVIIGVIITICFFLLFILFKKKRKSQF